MAKDYTILGTTITLLVLFAGVGIFSGQEWLSHQQTAILVKNMPTHAAVFLNENDTDRIDILLKSNKCPYIKIEVEDDVTQIKCGLLIAYEFKVYSIYEKLYGTDENVTNTRKVSSIQLRLVNETFPCKKDVEVIDRYGDNYTMYVDTTCQVPDRVVVEKSTQYYKGRQTRTAGTLTEEYIVTPERIKLNFNWDSLITERNIIALCFTKQRDLGLVFDGIEEFNIEQGTRGRCFLYGNKAGDLVIDPQWYEEIDASWDSEWDDYAESMTALVNNGTDGVVGVQENLLFNDSITHYYSFDETTWEYHQRSKDNFGSASDNITGLIDGGIELDGTGYQLLSTGTSYFYNARTLSFWFKSTQNGATVTYLSAPGNAGYYWGFQVDYTNDRLSIYTWDGSYDLGINWEGGWANYDDGVWHHAIISHKGGLVNLSNTNVWFDGVNKTSQYSVAWNAGTNPTNTSISGWVIGGANAASSYTDVDMDEWAIFDRALTSTEIGYLYNSGNGRRYNTTANIYTSVPNTTSNINWIYPNLTCVNPKSTGDCYVSISTDNGSTWSSWLSDANNSQNITVDDGTLVKFKLNITGNSTYTPIVTAFGMLSGEYSAPATSNFTLTLNEGFSGLFFSPNISKFNWTSFTVTDIASEAVNQSATSPIMEICNNDSVAGYVQMKLNDTSANHYVYCYEEYNYTLATNLSTSYANISSSIAQDECVDIWCWMDWNNASDEFIFNWTVEVQ